MLTRIKQQPSNTGCQYCYNCYGYDSDGYYYSYNIYPEKEYQDCLCMEGGEITARSGIATVVVFEREARNFDHFSQVLRVSLYYSRVRE